MSFNVSALSTFVDETSSKELQKKMFLEGDSTKEFVVMPGITSSMDIHTINTTLYAAALGCGWNGNSGSTALGKVNLPVDGVQYQEEICAATLKQYWLQTTMKPTAYVDSLGSIEASFAAEKADRISEMIETQIWQGNKVGGTGNNALVNGIIYKLDNVYSASTVNLTQSALTTSNAISVVDYIISNTPSGIKNNPNITLYMSYAEFDTYMVALRNANYYHYNPGQGIINEIAHPASRVKVKAMAGLNGLTRKVLTVPENIYVGVGEINDPANFDIWYSKDNKEHRLDCSYYLGTAVLYPEFLVRV